MNQTGQAQRGWASPLTRVVVAFLAIDALSGLWIYAAPFSVSSQLQVLVHTAAGLLLLIPLGGYLVSHIRDWYRQKLTAVMLLGYGLMLLVLVCALSGAILTWQATLGTRLSAGWDLIHLVTGLAAFALLAAHPLLAFLRRRSAISKLPDFSRALRRFCYGGASWLAATAALIGLAAMNWPEQRRELPLPAGYSLSEYVDQFDEYRGNPFAPTYARTRPHLRTRPRGSRDGAECAPVRWDRDPDRKRARRIH